MALKLNVGLFITRSDKQDVSLSAGHFFPKVSKAANDENSDTDQRGYMEVRQARQPKTIGVKQFLITQSGVIIAIFSQKISCA